jgi:hypothetical protein
MRRGANQMDAAPEAGWAEPVEALSFFPTHADEEQGRASTSSAQPVTGMASTFSDLVP